MSSLCLGILNGSACLALSFETIYLLSIANVAARAQSRAQHIVMRYGVESYAFNESSVISCSASAYNSYYVNQCYNIESQYIYIVCCSVASGTATKGDQQQQPQRSSKRSSYSYQHSYHSYHRYTNGHSKTAKNPQASTFFKTPLL